MALSVHYPSTKDIGKRMNQRLGVVPTGPFLLPHRSAMAKNGFQLIVVIISGFSFFEIKIYLTCIIYVRRTLAFYRGTK